MFTIISILVTLEAIVSHSRTFAMAESEWQEAKIREGVTREVIHPKGNKHTESARSLESNYVYGPLPLLATSQSCFPASHVTPSLSSSGERSARDVIKNSTICPLFNFTTSKSTTGRVKKTAHFLKFERNATIFDAAKEGGGSDVWDLAVVYGKGGKAEVKVAVDCLTGGGAGEGGNSEAADRSRRMQLNVTDEKDGVLYATFSVPISCDALDAVEWKEDGEAKVEGLLEQRQMEEEKEKKAKEQRSRKGCTARPMMRHRPDPLTVYP